MTDDPARITDSDLHALVDGELDAARRDDVEAAVAADAALAERVAAYRAQNSLLVAAFGSVADEPIPAAMTRLAARQAWWRRRWVPVAAAASLALAFGLGTGWLLGDHVVPAMRAGVQFASDGIAAHKVFSVEVRHPVEVSADEERHLVGWLSKRLDKPLRAPHLADVGYRLVGGRLLSATAGEPAAQLMYETSAGERLTLYVRQNRTDQEAAFRFVQAERVSAMYWLEKNLAYAIVAELPRDELMRVSTEIYEQLDED